MRWWGFSTGTVGHPIPNWENTPRAFSQFGRGGQGRDRTGDLPLFRRTLVPTELPGPKREAGPDSRKRTEPGRRSATLTGLEPATSAVTGRRANQLRYRALLYHLLLYCLRVRHLEGDTCVPPTGFEPVLPP